MFQHVIRIGDIGIHITPDIIKKIFRFRILIVIFYEWFNLFVICRGIILSHQIQGGITQILPVQVSCPHLGIDPVKGILKSLRIFQ